MKMKKTMMCLMLSLMCFNAFGYGFKAQSKGRSGTRSDSEYMFAKKSGCQVYTITCSWGLKEKTKKIKFKAITVVKTNSRRKYQYAFDEVAEFEIEPTPGKKFSIDYVTIATQAVDDNWKDIGYDMSRGLTVLGAVIEIYDDEGKSIFKWSNVPGKRWQLGIESALSDKETMFQNGNEENKEYNSEYIEGKDKGFNYWRLTNK